MAASGIHATPGGGIGHSNLPFFSILQYIYVHHILLMLMDHARFQLLVVRHEVATPIGGHTGLALFPFLNLRQAVLLGRLVAVDAQELLQGDHLWIEGGNI